MVCREAHRSEGGDVFILNISRGLVSQHALNTRHIALEVRIDRKHTARALDSTNNVECEYQTNTAKRCHPSA